MALLGGDGLYACETFWRTCRRAGVKGWVKTGEEGLSIIQDANGLFDARQLPQGVEYQEGVDAGRGCRLLQLIGVTLITAYRHWLETFKEKLKSLWDHGILSLKTLRMHLRGSLNPKGIQDTG